MLQGAKLVLGTAYTMLTLNQNQNDGHEAEGREGRLQGGKGKGKGGESVLQIAMKGTTLEIATRQGIFFEGAGTESRGYGRGCGRGGGGCHRRGRDRGAVC